MSESAGAPIETPIWPAFLAPVLQSLSSGETLHRKDVIRRAADLARLTDSALAEVLSSGGLRYEQRIGWAMSHLSKAGLIDRPERAHYAINDAGRSFLAEHPDGLDYAAAREFFRPFWPQRADVADGSDGGSEDLAVLDPIEQIEDGVRRNHAVVAGELLDRLLDSHPDFFEQAVVDLLLGMGYGGVEQRGRRIGGTGTAVWTGLSIRTRSDSIRYTFRRSATNRGATSGARTSKRSSGRSSRRGDARGVHHHELIHRINSTVRTRNSGTRRPHRW